MYACQHDIVRLSIFYKNCQIDNYTHVSFLTKLTLLKISTDKNHNLRLETHVLIFPIVTMFKQNGIIEKDILWPHLVIRDYIGNNSYIIYIF